MFPIKDTIPSRTTPYVNYTLIGICFSVFLFQLKEGPNSDILFFQYGLVPQRLTDPLIAAHFSWWEQGLCFFTNLFLHGGWTHLIGNLWFLWIFGDNVEDRLGHLPYLIFYLSTGILANGIHLLTQVSSQLPTVGASGAISGVLGAYFVLYPMARIIVLFPLFFVPFFFEVQAFFFIGLWFFVQLLSGTEFLFQAPEESGGVAWWAHIGGFLAGLILVRFFLKVKKEDRRFFKDEFFPW